mgnify:CR=1 FL=1
MGVMHFYQFAVPQQIRVTFSYFNNKSLIEDRYFIFTGRNDFEIRIPQATIAVHILQVNTSMTQKILIDTIINLHPLVKLTKNLC